MSYDYPLKQKYRVYKPTKGTTYKARTGNSHGGPKSRKKDGQSAGINPAGVVLVLRPNGKRELVREVSA